MTSVHPGLIHREWMWASSELKIRVSTSAPENILPHLGPFTFSFIIMHLEHMCGLIWFSSSLYYSYLACHLTRAQVTDPPWLIFPCNTCTHVCMSAWTTRRWAYVLLKFSAHCWKGIGDRHTWREGHLNHMTTVVNLEGSFGLLFPFSCAVDQTPPLVATNWVCTQAHWTFQSLTCLVPLHLSFFFTSRILMMFRWQGGLRCYSLLIIKQSFIRQL